MMKYILFLLSSVVSSASFSQVLNGSFENGSFADLSHWEWTCGSDSLSSAPPGGGSWCIKVSGGNYQSCFPGYAYQKLPSITSGQTFILSGWAYSQASPTVGIYFGKITNDTISLQTGSTTASTSWTQLSVQSDFTLSAGDTAVLVLYGGLTGGPIQGYGYFDLVNLQQVTGINSFDQISSITISPNPFSSQTTIHAVNIFQDATFTVINAFGETMKQIKNISGQSITFNRDNIPAGLYIIRLTQDSKAFAIAKMIITGN